MHMVLPWWWGVAMVVRWVVVVVVGRGVHGSVWIGFVSNPVDPGWVCAQPGLDPKDSGGRNHKSHPACVELQIGWIGSCQFRVHIGQFRVRYMG